VAVAAAVAVAVAVVEPGLVGQPVEQLGAHVVQQRGEVVLVAEGVPTPPGKRQSPVNRCGVPSGSSYSRAMEPGVWLTRWIASSSHSPTRIRSPSSTSTSVVTGMPGASSSPAYVVAPVASTTSGRACQWSPCWWVVGHLPVSLRFDGYGGRYDTLSVSPSELPDELSSGLQDGTLRQPVAELDALCDPTTESEPRMNLPMAWIEVYRGFIRENRVPHNP
jgi:hypothetical protein